VATTFERRSYGVELELCRRYCQKVDEYFGVSGTYAFGASFGTALIDGKFDLSPVMRVGPTFVNNTATTWDNDGAPAANVCSAYAVPAGWMAITGAFTFSTVSSNAKAWTFRFAAGTSFTNSNAGMCLLTCGGTSAVLSAEL